MKIVVCVKQVNDEINPFDACALECALSIPNADVELISMGKPQAADMLKALTRLGVNRAILLTDNAFAGADTLATSYVLALAIRKLKPDLVICGRQSVDGDTAQVGPCLSQMLGFSLITNVMQIHRIDNEISCLSRMSEESVKLPALLTVEKINKLRFPSIRAKVKDVEIWTADHINADLNRCGLKGSPTKVLRTYESIVGKRKCRYIKPCELLSIIKSYKNRKRNEIEYAQSQKKLDEIWVVGEELEKIALSIAEKVEVIDKGSAVGIAELAGKHNPKVILWNSDLWGRRNAPIAAALLQTGLCADCTHLKTDGEKLYMYRPAYGGILIAKIECRTYPQMATVRTVTKAENNIVVAGGKGVKDSLDLIRGFAGEIGAELGASRGLVDMGIAPYEMQIGLTGKNVNPGIYIACGISGTVQHTCGIEQSGIIIAINTDKNARIFEYADYGIVADVREVLLCDKGDYKAK
jgi:Electron transfer flavoprotein, alpha subunit